MTQAIGQELIERLAAGVRPLAAGEEAGSVGGDRFRDLLMRAAASVQTASLPVTVGRGVTAEIDPQTLDRLAPLVDQAQEQGASRALVLTDEGLLRVDVLRRRIEGVVDPATEGDVLTGFDSVLDARNRTVEPGELTGPLLLPDSGWSASAHDSLLRALSESVTFNR